MRGGHFKRQIVRDHGVQRICGKGCWVGCGEVEYMWVKLAGEGKW